MQNPGVSDALRMGGLVDPVIQLAGWTELIGQLAVRAGCVESLSVGRDPLLVGGRKAGNQCLADPLNFFLNWLQVLFNEVFAMLLQPLPWIPQLLQRLLGLQPVGIQPVSDSRELRVLGDVPTVIEHQDTLLLQGNRCLSDLLVRLCGDSLWLGGHWGRRLLYTLSCLSLLTNNTQQFIKQYLIGGVLCCLLLSQRPLPNQAVDLSSLRCRVSRRRWCCRCRGRSVILLRLAGRRVTGRCNDRLNLWRHRRSHSPRRSDRWCRLILGDWRV